MRSRIRKAASCDKVQELNVYVVIQRKVKLLVLKRSDSEIWEFSGGGIEFGEHPSQAAEREVLEETGLRVKAGKLICATSSVYSKGNLQKHSLYFVYLAKSARGKVSLSKEHSAYKWVSKSEAKKLRLGYNAIPVLGYL